MITADRVVKIQIKDTELGIRIFYAIVSRWCSDNAISRPTIIILVFPSHVLW